MMISNNALIADAQQQVQHISSNKFTVFLARDEQTRNRCLKLRYDVFAGELGAELNNSQGLDKDRFDPGCHHLAVVDNRTSEIIATTRILDNAGRQQTGIYYSETEFDIKNILDMNLNFAEVGRTCVHPDYRRSSALPMLWRGIGRFATENQIDYLFGCASVPFSNGDKYLSSVMTHLRARHFSPENLRVTPRVPLRLDYVDPQPDDVILPTLLKGYIRQGALICGEPYWDAAFGVADVFVLLDCNTLNHRFSKHFFEQK